MNAQVRDLGTMALVGDGFAGLIRPRQHTRNWKIGPRAFRNFMDKFIRHPNLTRVISAAEVGVGVWLIAKQRPR